MSDKVCLEEITTAVRELSFDRFVVPAFAIRQMGENCFIDIDPEYKPDDVKSDEAYAKGKLSIYSNSENAEGETERKNIVDLPFNEYRTLEILMNALIKAGIVVAYTPYFIGTEPSASLILNKNKPLSEDFTVFRRNFFSDSEIVRTIEWYYAKVLEIYGADVNDELIGRLKRPAERHMAIWVAYHLVDKRRVYENAASSVSQSFTDGSDYVGSSDNGGIGTTTTVQIGSVFSISEDPTRGYFYEDFSRIGSDNFWGDRYSFWYKLMIYLRDLLETQFGDYSLRKDTVMQGNIVLQRELDFRSYFDSYPFTLSPLSRGILSKVP